MDHELKFDDHGNYIYKKTSQKLNALARIAPFVNVDKRRIIINSLIELHFGYCTVLLWVQY